jgi:tetratricopeptide (TPR) repeat protein
MKWDGQGRLLKKIFTVTWLATALLAPMHLEAQYNYNSPRELALLPPYCKYTQSFQNRVEGGNDPEKIKQWYSIMRGSDSRALGIFEHIHHYCEGLMDVNYAKFFARSKGEREGRLIASIRQFDYVIRESTPGERLLPEFHTKKGETLVALGRGPLAIAEFQRAIVLKPDYWPPYAALSDYYKETGNIKMARELLEQGLSSSPEATALTRRLAELDAVKGKPKTAAEVGAKPPSDAAK